MVTFRLMVTRSDDVFRKSSGRTNVRAAALVCSAAAIAAITLTISVRACRSRITTPSLPWIGRTSGRAIHIPSGVTFDLMVRRVHGQDSTTPHRCDKEARDRTEHDTDQRRRL